MQLNLVEKMFFSLQVNVKCQLLIQQYNNLYNKGAYMIFRINKVMSSSFNFDKIYSGGEDLVEQELYVDRLIAYPLQMVILCHKRSSWIQFDKSCVYLDEDGDIVTDLHRDERGMKTTLLCIAEPKIHERKHEIIELCKESDICLNIWSPLDSEYDVFKDDFFKDYISSECNYTSYNPHKFNVTDGDKSIGEFVLHFMI